jgi:hypothetical protein
VTISLVHKLIREKKAENGGSLPVEEDEETRRLVAEKLAQYPYPSIIGPLGMFSTLSFSKHPLSKSTLIDNCSAIHVVNSKDLLILSSFQKAKGNEHIEASTTAFPIAGRGRHLSLDCLLRFGTLEKNVVVKQLTRMYNLVFLEYIPLSLCSSIPSSVPVSVAGTVVMATTIEQVFRRVKAASVRRSK